MFYTLIGSNVYNSISPIIYYFFFDKLNYKYYKVSSKKKKIFIHLIYFIKISYFINITIPFKKKVIIFSNYFSKKVKKSKSTNFLLKYNNSILSYSTDGTGFRNTFKKIYIKDKINVVIFGAGGASRAIFIEIKKNKKIKIIYLYNRTKKKLNYYKKYNKYKSINIKNNKIEKKLIINTIPLKFFINIIKKNKTKFKKCFIYDISYKTFFSFINFDGTLMLYKQAIECYKIYKKNENL